MASDEVKSRRGGVREGAGRPKKTDGGRKWQGIN